MKANEWLETVIERLIFQSRWLVLPFYAGLIAALLIYAYAFCGQVFQLFLDMHTKSSEDILVVMLTLVDKVLIANLMVMVVIGGYENAVSRLNITHSERNLSWLGKLDASSLKAKLATSIVSIAFVRLLLVFLDLEHTSDRDVYATVGIFIVMLLGAFVVSMLDWWSTKLKRRRVIEDKKLKS